MAHPDPALIVQQSNVIMLALDQAGCFVALNPAAERFLARPAADLLGQPFTTVLDPFSHEKAALMLDRTLAEGGVVDWELDHLQPTGAPVLVGYTTSVWRDDAGQAGGLIAIGRDLTGQLELTARLAETNQQLEGALLQLEKTHAALKSTQAQLVQSEKMRALGQMVAGVAHEINNPAAFVANNLAHLAQLMPGLTALFAAYAPLKPLADADQQRALAQAEAAVEIDYVWQDLPDVVRESQEGLERIRNIVLSLRNFARLDEAARKEADINEGLRSTVRLVRSQCKDRIDIREAYTELPTVMCRPGELNQVFLNLLMNAMQAIEGAGTIEVTSTRTSDCIVVTVRDSGPGMSAATLARLGEPFFTTKPIGAGTGLGLAVSLSIVEQHHGRLHYDSRPGAGATAIVEIPIVYPEAVTTQPHPPAPSPEIEKMISGEGEMATPLS
jgi:two-component system, NtrC family, sensor kinase